MFHYFSASKSAQASQCPIDLSYWTRGLTSEGHLLTLQLLNSLLTAIFHPARSICMKRSRRSFLSSWVLRLLITRLWLLSPVLLHLFIWSFIQSFIRLFIQPFRLCYVKFVNEVINSLPVVYASPLPRLLKHQPLNPFLQLLLNLFESLYLLFRCCLIVNFSGLHPRSISFSFQEADAGYALHLALWQ